MSKINQGIPLYPTPQYPQYSLKFITWPGWTIPVPFNKEIKGDSILYIFEIYNVASFDVTANKRFSKGIHRVQVNHLFKGISQ